MEEGDFQSYTSPSSLIKFVTRLLICYSQHLVPNSICVPWKVSVGLNSTLGHVHPNRRRISISRVSSGVVSQQTRGERDESPTCTGLYGTKRRRPGHRPRVPTREICPLGRERPTGLRRTHPKVFSVCDRPGLTDGRGPRGRWGCRRGRETDLVSRVSSLSCVEVSRWGPVRLSVSVLPRPGGLSHDVRVASTTPTNGVRADVFSSYTGH